MTAEQPASATLAPGTLIVNAIRMPRIIQPWIHDIYIGVIRAPGTDLSWNGKNSEAHYCEVTGTIPVSYPFGTRHDHVCDLMPITAEQAALTGRERVQFFLGAAVLWQLERHRHTTWAESEAYWKHLGDFVPPSMHVICINGLPGYPYSFPADEVPVGIVEAPETGNEAAGNTLRQVVRVRYGKGVRHEPTGALMPVTAEQAALGVREKIEYFLGAVAVWHYDQQMITGKEGIAP